MQYLEICSIPVITALCYALIDVLKRTLGKETKAKNTYPLIAALLGSGLGVFVFLVEPNLMVSDSILGAAFAGMASGLAATGGNQLWDRLKGEKTVETTDDSPARYYITGDKHRHFEGLIQFCKDNHLRRKDVIVILGDTGFNYYGDERDDQLKTQLSQVNVTLFCLHGNKENRPQNIPTYGIRTFAGGTVYYEPRYPNIFFAKDGEVYRFHDREYIVIGGAHSVDKLKCLDEELPYWGDEMPDQETKAFVEAVLEDRGYTIDGYLTHTCPLSCLPTEMFISTQRAASKTVGKTSRKWHWRRKQRKVVPAEKRNEYPLDIDRSTEEWLESLKQRSDFGVWYCGHYHVDKELGKVCMLKDRILPFATPDEDNL